VQKTKADTQATRSSGIRVIKKYPNRRLYDTDTSSYITLAEIKQLVMDDERFVVRDAKSNEDLTRSILLQVILEEETAGVPIFSEQVLANIIRFFMDVQKKMAEQSKVLTPELFQQFLTMQSPLMQGMMGTYMEQSKNAFIQMQDQMQRNSEQMLSAMGLKR
jgi:polyhydroxyalkanoate synthesis repressor PhaR